MAQHTPQWRLDIAMMVEALEKTRPSFASMKGYPAHEAILKAVDDAIKLGKQYALNNRTASKRLTP